MDSQATVSPNPEGSAEEAAAGGKGGKAPVSVDVFCQLANKFIDQGMHNEAINLYETACRIHPDSIALKINLGRARQLKQKAEEGMRQEFEQDYLKRREKRDQVSNAYQGLGDIYLQRGNVEKAIEAFELAKLNNPTLFYPYLKLGEVYLQREEMDKARQDLERAKQLNPFNETINRLLGRVYFNLQDFKRALEAYCDAFILSGGQDRKENDFYNKKIRFIFDKQEISSKEARAFYFRQRTDQFNSHVKTLAEKKREFLDRDAIQQMNVILARTKEVTQDRRNLLEVAQALKALPFGQDMGDEALFKVAKIVVTQKFQRGDAIFRENQDSDTVYILHQGIVQIQRETPFGAQKLSEISQDGTIFGEMNYIDGMTRSADALAMTDAVLFQMNRENLDMLFEDDREIAVHFLWHFWHSLSDKTREANELLKSFFTEDAQQKRKPSEMKTVAGKEAEIDLEEKARVLEEKGLSSKELRLLATFSTEELFQQDEVIFHEGDEGNKLYIVLDGKVRISKNIPGVGEEALAILERGDFFGEMALIDNEPRSATAIGHVPDTMTLSIDKQALDEILSMDIESAHLFLSILCRILSHRLREIDLKIVQWRMMAGF